MAIINVLAGTQQRRGVQGVLTSLKNPSRVSKYPHITQKKMRRGVCGTDGKNVNHNTKLFSMPYNTLK